ncbi:MAG TPA: PepSY-associated TM helix domain-containing protein [Cellvibrionaceae bacterium]
MNAILTRYCTLPDWLGSVRQWHWISSAVCLIGMLLFALTGITLNHAGQIEGRAKVTTIEQVLPDNLLPVLQQVRESRAPLPPKIRAWFNREMALNLPAHLAEWDDYEVYQSLPQPGGDAWLTIDRASGDFLYERTDRGWIAFFNDLHKGRNTGSVWSWFIDIFAVACVIFCLTGLVLLKRHAANRPTTWPLVGLGLVLPWVLILLFMH